MNFKVVRRSKNPRAFTPRSVKPDISGLNSGAAKTMPDISSLNSGAAKTVPDLVDKLPIQQVNGITVPTTVGGLAKAVCLSADFLEAVDDRVALTLVAGAGITLTYDDVLNTITISAP